MLKPLSKEQKLILQGGRPGLLPIRYAKLWKGQGFDVPDDIIEKRLRPQTGKKAAVKKCEHLGQFLGREPCTCGSSRKVNTYRCNLLGKICVPNGHAQLANPEHKSFLDCSKCPHLSLVRSRVDRFANSFVASGTARFVTSAQLQEDVKLLCGKIPPDVTAIAGVARSGLAVATMVSMYLHLPMVTIRQTMGDVVATGNGWRIGGNRHVDPQRQKVAVIDDTVMTGNSFSALDPLLKKEFKDYVRCAVYVNPKAKVKPDIWAIDLGWPHLLEWNLFNSVLSPNMAVDFDGILCRDCAPHQDDDGEQYLNFIRNATPLYMARKVPIPLIVTARIRKYREETLKWLDRHGIKVNKLIMHPAETLAERHRDDIAAYKAKRFDSWAKRHRAVPPPLAFVESQDWQARKIHQITGRMTICPHSAKVYS